MSPKAVFCGTGLCVTLSTVPRPAGPRIELPGALVSWHRKLFGETGRAWIDTVPDLATGLLDRSQLPPDGASTCGATVHELRVVRADAMPAVLKLQPVTDHTVGEPDAPAHGTETAPYACWTTTPNRVRCCSNGSTPTAHWPPSATTWTS